MKNATGQGAYYFPGPMRKFAGRTRVWNFSQRIILWEQTFQQLTMSPFSSFLSSLISILLLCCPISFAVSIPQTLRHTNLLRTIDLTKPYVRDSTALILENFSNSTQREYFWGIPHEIVPKLSYLEVREKKTGAGDLFPVESYSNDHPYFSWIAQTECRLLQIYRVQIPELKPEEKISLVISSAYIDCLVPHPAIVEQDGKQYLVFTGEKYAPTLYTTMKQKTKIK